jgi:hypothetical protein
MADQTLVMETPKTIEPISWPCPPSTSEIKNVVGPSDKRTVHTLRWFLRFFFYFFIFL